jgi:hypothetical protein
MKYNIGDKVVYSSNGYKYLLKIETIAEEHFTANFLEYLEESKFSTYTIGKNDGTKFPFEYTCPEEIYNSPLFNALQEDN